MSTAAWAGCAPGNFAAGRPGGYHPEAVVIHVMDGTFAGTRSWFNDRRAQVSAHYGISAAGRIDQYVKESDTAFHAGVVARPSWALLKPRVNPNFYTIGIEHEGRGDDAGWQLPQLAASAGLLADIAKRWSIPLDNAHVVPHHAIRNDKSCPGPHRTVAELLQAAGAMGAPTPPSADPALVAAAGDRKVLALANARTFPSTQSAIKRVLSPGYAFASLGAVTGEPVDGNPIWYINAAGEYLWAGATDRPVVT